MDDGSRLPGNTPYLVACSALVLRHRRLFEIYPVKPLSPNTATDLYRLVQRLVTALNICESATIRNQYVYNWLKIAK
jgi:hypothetical protein